MFRNTLPIIFLLVFILNATIALPSIAPPSLRCITVLSNNDVQLNWIQPTDTASIFESYHIFSSNSGGGPFTLLDSIFNYNTTTYLHTGANANTDSVFYYLQTRYNSGGLTYSSSSDTLRTIFLTLNKDVSGQAGLSWSQMHSPKLPTSSNWYRIYREYPTGSWTLIDSTQYGIENYSEAIMVCADSLKYRIEVADSFGCVSVSPVAGEWFTDNTPPATPSIDSVSVDPTTGYATVGWIKNPSGDTEGYIITRNIGTNWVLDTIWGITNTIFQDINSDPSKKSEQYGVAAFDSCWLGSPPSPNTSPTGILHRSIYVEGMMDQCNRSITIKWNKYEGWSGVSNYKIYVSENGGQAQLIQTNSSSDTTYTHTNLTPYSNYCYTIRATEAGGVKTSTSNRLCITLYIPQQPNWHYLNNVSVIAENIVDISCYVDTKADVQSYLFKRATDSTFGFQTVAEVLSIGNSIITYTDGTAETDKKSYYYKVMAKDVCGDEIMTSNAGRTILCTVSADANNMLNTIQWNDYVDWDTAGSGVNVYNIYRSTNGIFDIPLATLPSNAIYTDDVSSELTASGEFCYYIEAEEGTGNKYGFIEKSRSNIACVYYDPIIWVPNAFTPNGDNINDVFKPVMSFIPSNDYLLYIYNRWGDTVFESSNINESWDGTLNNEKAQNGLYLYYITYKTGEGKSYERKGSVILVR